MADDRAEVSAPSIPGWEAFADSLRALPAHVFARLPASVRDDPQAVQEIGRRTLAALAMSVLDALGGDADYPVFLPLTGQVINFGQPNADTGYLWARVSPDGTYRLRGDPGNLRMAIMGQADPFPGEAGGEGLTLPGGMRAYHDLKALRLDGDGRFDVLLSPTRPAGCDGDWWKLEPTTNKLFLRMVMADWNRERDVTISIDRVDTPAARPRRTAADLEQRLRRLPEVVAFYSTVEIDHVELLRQGGFVHKMTEYDTSQMVGLAGQYYFECAYDLADDEALIIEAEIPADCSYWSVIMTNEIFETTDWYNNHSCLNDTQARRDHDGVVRYVVSARDPGAPNWLDTGGYRTGEVQGRLFGCSKIALPSVRKVAFDQVRANLPADTPTVTRDERDRTIRERRMRLQQRRLW